MYINNALKDIIISTIFIIILTLSRPLVLNIIAISIEKAIKQPQNYQTEGINEWANNHLTLTPVTLNVSLKCTGKSKGEIRSELKLTWTL